MEDQAFIGRQPILDIKQQIIGYELLFRHNADATNAVFDDELKISSRVLVTTLNDMGTQWLLGDKYAFINVNEEMLGSQFLELLPPKRTVLEVAKTVVPSEAVMERCKALRTKGFQIALDNPIQSTTATPLLTCVDYIKIDILEIGLTEATKVFNLYNVPPVKIVAEKVETLKQFETCKQIGFKLFQGYYFARPETLSAKIIHPSYSNVLSLLNMVNRDAEAIDIETGFKRDAALSFKLLRYINSAGFGLSCEIQSIRHALTILGTKQLYRWLTLLLATADGNTASPALMKTSITRGRLTELLGESYFDKKDRDNLFIVGVFSLLDVMLDMPMGQVLEKIQLSDTVSEALLSRKGIYGPFLELAEACEGADGPQIIRLAESLQFDPSKVNNCHMTALAWVEKLGI
jgi:EAL and modified HD-GYP domain-containing signal transduction protein